MFTGIIEAVGKIEKIEDLSGDKRFFIVTNKLDISDVRVGDSISVNGVCLTATNLLQYGFMTDVSKETLDCTTFDNLRVGSEVNLEKALSLNARLNGHMVSGHVDGVGRVNQCVPDGRSERFTIAMPATLSKYICKKGSICVDGVSLTVNDTGGTSFSVNIIPHTLQETTFHGFIEGTRVNLEVDIIARYLESLVATQVT